MTFPKVSNFVTFFPYCSAIKETVIQQKWNVGAGDHEEYSLVGNKGVYFLSDLSRFRVQTLWRKIFTFLNEIHCEDLLSPFQNVLKHFKIPAVIKSFSGAKMGKKGMFFDGFCRQLFARVRNHKAFQSGKWKISFLPTKNPVKKDNIFTPFCPLSRNHNVFQDRKWRLFLIFGN